jgi:hypothetical protein
MVEGIILSFGLKMAIMTQREYGDQAVRVLSWADDLINTAG